jgi:hypothetical protein
MVLHSKFNGDYFYYYYYYYFHGGSALECKQFRADPQLLFLKPPAFGDDVNNRSLNGHDVWYLRLQISFMDYCIRLFNTSVFTHKIVTVNAVCANN